MSTDSIVQLVQETVTGEIFGVWMLVASVIIFSLHAGFVMLESGFTRSKNAGNTIMKILVDICIGTIVFSLLGYSLMMAEDYLFGFIGVPDLSMLSDFRGFVSGEGGPAFIFNLVVCGVTAMIMSGAVAERMKFSSYCIISTIITVFIYPVACGWSWNPNGWLAQMGFHDFAGSASIHTLGGVMALIGAIMVGPRLGKYIKDKRGKVTKINAIQGHNIPLGSIGALFLWCMWYGFNGAAAWNTESMVSIFVTNTVAPAVAMITTMLITLIKNGKPDVSMSVNGALGGLVAITAGCDTVNAVGAAAIGIVSGILIVVVIEGVDLKLHIDDPVGAIGVHLANGIWGTAAVGLFADPAAPGGYEGLLYTGNPGLLGVQLLGLAAVIGWTTVCITSVFALVKKTIGVRVSADEEIRGLDSSEHGLLNAYADFNLAVESIDYGYSEALAVSGDIPAAEAVPVKRMPVFDDGTPKMTKVEIICKEARLETLKSAMMKIGITGMTVSHVLGCGIQKGKPEYYRGVQVEANLLPKIQVDIVVSSVPVRSVIETAKRVLYTGHIGDGKIFVYDVENVIKVRTGEEGYAALQDVE